MKTHFVGSFESALPLAILDVTCRLISIYLLKHPVNLYFAVRTSRQMLSVASFTSDIFSVSVVEFLDGIMP